MRSPFLSYHSPEINHHLHPHRLPPPQVAVVATSRQYQRLWWLVKKGSQWLSGLDGDGGDGGGRGGGGGDEEWCWSLHEGMMLHHPSQMA